MSFYRYFANPRQELEAHLSVLFNNYRLLDFRNQQIIRGKLSPRFSGMEKALARSLNSFPGRYSFEKVGDETFLTISTTVGDFTNISPIPITIDFQTPVTVATLDLLAIDGGVASNPQSQSVDDSIWNLDITPAADGIVTVEMLADSYQDNAGNWNLASNLLTIIDSS